MVRFLARLFVILFALFLALVGCVMFSNGNRNLAYFEFAVAALLLLYRRKRLPKSWRDDPASYRQTSYATELGIRFHKNITKGELSDLISERTGKRPFR